MELNCTYFKHFYSSELYNIIHFLFFLTRPNFIYKIDQTFYDVIFILELILSHGILTSCWPPRNSVLHFWQGISTYLKKDTPRMRSISSRKINFTTHRMTLVTNIFSAVEGPMFWNSGSCGKRRAMKVLNSISTSYLITLASSLNILEKRKVFGSFLRNQSVLI